MLGKYFYHQTIRKTTVGLGTLLNNLYVVRYNSSGTEIERLRVPVRYGPHSKPLTRAEGNLDNEAAIVYPRIGFQLVNLSYDAARGIQPLMKRRKVIDDNTKNYAYNPVPYNVDYVVEIATKNVEESSQILEQILPFFKPSFTFSIKLLEDVDADVVDVPFSINNITYQDTYEGSFEERRLIVWTISLTAKTWFFGPVEASGIIRKVLVDMYIPEDIDSGLLQTPRKVRITTEPDPIDANPDDDYGFSTTIEEFEDGKRRNPETGIDEEI